MQAKVSSSEEFNAVGISSRTSYPKESFKNQGFKFRDVEDEEEERNRREFSKKHEKRISLFKPHITFRILKVEITLEGLDGITLQALWVRLKDSRQLTFKIDEQMKKSIWEIIKLLPRIEFFLLPEPRPDLVLHKRAKFKDERGNLYEPTTAPLDIYEYAPIERYVKIEVPTIRLSRTKSKPGENNDNATKKDKGKRNKGALKKDSKKSQDKKGKSDPKVVKTKPSESNIGGAIEIKPSTSTKKVTITKEKPVVKLNKKGKKGNLKKEVHTTEKDKEGVKDNEKGEKAKERKEAGSLMNTPISSTFMSSRVIKPRKRKRRVAPGKGQTELIRGSCPTYHTRVDVTKKVMVLSYEQVSEEYGNRLVVVSSQQDREEAIFSSTKHVRGDLNIIQYCIMERVARARFEGEPTRGNVSLANLKIEAKSLFHQRKALVRGNLFRKQMVPMKFGPTRAPCFTTVFHLPRFYKFVETGVTSALRKVFNVLKSKPEYYEETAKMKKLFGKHMVMNLIDGPHGCLFRQYDLPLSQTRKEMYEDTATSDKVRDQMDRKLIKVMALVKPNLDIESYVRKPCDEKLDCDGEDDEEEAGTFNIHDMSMGVDSSLMPHLMKQVWMEGGTTGVSLSDISKKFSVTPLEARTAGRLLTRLKFAQTVLSEKQKTKVHKYVMKDLYGLNKIVKKLNQRDPSDVGNKGAKPLSLAKKKLAREANRKKFVENSGEHKKIPFIDVSQEQVVAIEVELVENSTTKFETSEGWEVTIDPLPIPKEPHNYDHYKTLKTIERERYILEFIKSQKFIVGFAPILTSLKRYEARVGETVEVDKKTVARVVQQMHSKEKIRIWSVTVNKDEANYKASVYTVPDVVPVPDGVMGDVVQELIDRCTKKPKPNKVKRKRFSQLIKPTSVRASRGPHRTMKESGYDLDSSFSAAYAANEMKREQKYDDIDRSVIEKLKAQRALWSAEEDNQILYLFMASVLFMPKYDFKRIFIFNAAQIRDILHDKLQESVNKTSIAVRRRIHHLLKKERQLAAYEYFVGKALNDEFLHTNLLQRYRNDIDERKVFSKVPNDALLEVSEYLYSKFGGKTGLQTFDIRAVEQDREEMSGLKNIGPWELRWKEEEEQTCLIVSALDDPRNEEEIKLWLSRSALLSLILCGDNYEVLQSFLQPLEDESLEDAIGAMRQLELITVEKKSLKFSISYLVRKRMAPYLSPTGYSLADTFINSAISVEEVDLTSFYEPSIFALLAELSIRGYVDYTIIFPDSVICVNEEWRQIFETLINNDEEEQSEESSSGESEEEEIRIPPPPKFHRIQEIDDDEPANKRRRVETISSKLEQIIERNFVLINNEKVPRKLIAVPNVVQMTKGHQELEPEMISEEKTVIISKGGVTKNVSDISNKALRFLRERMNSDENNDRRVERDFFSIVLPKVSAKLESGVGDLFVDKQRSDQWLASIQNLLYVVIPTQFLEGKTHMPRIPSIKPKWKKLYTFIESFGSMGISILYLKKNMERSELIEGLNVLFNQKAIFIVGVANRRAVAFSFIFKWAMAVPQDSSNNKETHMVIMRPWVRCNGGINWHLIDFALTAIISFLTQHPVLNMTELADFTRPFISPLESMILLMVLQVGDIVKISAVEEPTKVFLFSELTSVRPDFNMMVDFDEAEVILKDFPTLKYTALRKSFEVFLESMGDDGLKVYQKDPATDGRRKKTN